MQDCTCEMKEYETKAKYIEWKTTEHAMGAWSASRLSINII